MLQAKVFVCAVFVLSELPDVYVLRAIISAGMGPDTGSRW